MIIFSVLLGYKFSCLTLCYNIVVLFYNIINLHIKWSAILFNTENLNMNDKYEVHND